MNNFTIQWSQIYFSDKKINPTLANLALMHLHGPNPAQLRAKIKNQSRVFRSHAYFIIAALGMLLTVLYHQITAEFRQGAFDNFRRTILGVQNKL